MAVTLLNGRALTGSFTPSQPIQIAETDLTLFFDAVLSGGPTTVEFYLEYTEQDPNDAASTWRREVDEVDDGAGLVTHNAVVRTFGSLADATYNFALQFQRKAPYARLQSRVSAGAAALTVIAPYGSKPNSP